MTTISDVRSRVLVRWRWLVYVSVGILFGIFDYYFQPLAQQDGSLVVRIAVIYGIWLVPLVPIALYETRASRSIAKTALVCAVTWSVAIITYYLYMAVELMLIGKASRPELHVSNMDDPYYWTNIGQVFGGDVSGGIVEWMMLAIIGGAIVGVSVAWLYLQLATRVRRADSPFRREE